MSGEEELDATTFDEMLGRPAVQVEGEVLIDDFNAKVAAGLDTVIAFATAGCEHMAKDFLEAMHEAIVFQRDTLQRVVLSSPHDSRVAKGLEVVTLNLEMVDLTMSYLQRTSEIARRIYEIGGI